ncbi:MAG: putative phosphodiesterase [Gammaproteobacteria bacterium]|jgi:predicted phosphodiesterase
MQFADPQFGMFRSLSRRSPERRLQVWDRFRRVNLVGDEDPYVPEGVTDLAPESARLDAAVDVANERKPAFVVVCGDLVNNIDDDEQAAAFQASMRRLDPSIVLHCVPGNHDLSHNFKRPVADGLSAYRAAFGPDYYCFAVGDALFLALNSETIYDASEVVGEDKRQLAFVADTLTSTQMDAVRHIVVLMHRPLYVRPPGHTYSGHIVQPPGRVALAALLRSAGKPVTVFSGHLHQNRYVDAAPISQVSSGPIGFALRGESGFRKVSVVGESVVHEYVPIATNDAMTSAPRG